MSFPAPGLSWQGWGGRVGEGKGRGGRLRWGVGAQPADAASPLPVGRQESRHLLCKLSDDNHHLMAPKRQRGPCLQRLWPLLQAAQCESTPPRPDPPLPGDRCSLCSLVRWGGGRRGAATISGVAWLGRRLPLPSARRPSHKRGPASWKCVPHGGGSGGGGGSCRSGEGVSL